MYKLSIPVMNHSVTRYTRDKYLQQLKKAKADRIFLSIFGYADDPTDDLKTVEELRENIDFFQANGIQADVWIGSTLGHGVQLSVSADNICDMSKYRHMVNVLGEEQKYVCCPYDENFRKRISQYVANVALSGANTILLDDDFRMSQRGEEFCCACDMHMERIRELCQENISREELRRYAFSGKPNKYRDAWLQAQRESLELLAHDIRCSVDKVSYSTRIGICTAHSLWGVDGADPIKLAKIMCGEKNVPLLRLHGAPYWSVCSDTSMISVVETARMFASFCSEEAVETMAEGDVYPRPRYNTPAAPLEMFDAAMRIDGRHSGILKYMIDYNSSPEFEMGYISRHSKNLEIMNELTEMFSSKKELGVNVSVDLGQFSKADFDLSVVGYYPRPPAGEMMANCGLSTVYGDGGICNAIFGEQARHIDVKAIAKGAIIDALAAGILMEKGIDVGLISTPEFKMGNADYLIADGEKACVWQSDIRYSELTVNKNADVLCSMEIDGKKKTFAYKYQNESGQKFVVFCFDAMGLPRNTGIYRGYIQQYLVKNAVEWISEKNVPAYIEKCPQLYVMCKGDGNKMAVAMFNFFEDSVEEPKIKLDGEYRSIRFVNCDGVLNKDTVALNSPIPAYSFIAFEIEK